MGSIVNAARRTVWLLGLCLLATAAIAQQRHSGDYHILQARYGSGERGVDVTSRVLELVRGGQNFVVSNEALGGDPLPGVTKTLRITVRGADGRIHGFDYPEGQLVQPGLFSSGSGGTGRPGWPAAEDRGTLRILHARYGTVDRNVDVTARLRELARSDMSFRVSNEALGGDPHPRAEKILRIFAAGPDGRTRTVDFREGDSVDGAQFSGWRGGQWGQSAWRGGWQAEDLGHLQILHARYGTPERNVDVTARLRELARGDLGIRVSNEVFGTDPHPRALKTLRIFARGSDGRTQVIDVAEGDAVDAAQFTAGAPGGGRDVWSGGWNGADRGDHVILHARYGTAERNVDVTPRLRELARRDSSFRVDNEVLGGDPHPFATKTLRLFTRGPDGREHTFEYREGETVSGAMFVGWGSGRFGQDAWRGGWSGGR